ncbi:hypothetical protein DICPUDRAFT_88818 [Dictyostelium purpureum]|uniref:UDP-N-acetylglucosamine transferase subunit ALG14 n=1 Tax=Dictyostelium purpureum TaxID=5786 RepID=F0ZRT5_DICPU|nr:uncharacterized protein DICPUDRAFT_88818 [Dictyostelium purpureum]EGC33342.1 hypothetical protein DICPUDRAFT_88818 [Dictyostelium purpureum]|eukprot:XP_003290127.1 hypothetical protein DICPUDRAFT_88818 [Dictyostelium purpureum]
MAKNKIVFVTVGTTKFDDLIDKVDTPKFFNLLKELGYNKLIIQIGNYTKEIENSVPLTKEIEDSLFGKSSSTFDSYYFDYRPSLSDYMKNADLIVSHAGSGSIVESLENNKPCLCVVNDKLMHNHQVELADKLSELCYILSSTPDSLYENFENGKLVEYINNREHLDPSILNKSQKLFANSLKSEFNIKGDQTNNNKSLKTMVVLGSGGHTTEMFYLLKNVDRSRFNPFVYVLADNDKRSEDKIFIEESNYRKNDDKESRNVGQSYIHSIFTTLIALFYSMLLIFKERPDVLICNGPGTCVPLCLAVKILTWLRIKKSKVVYIESLARVKDLSLSGKILQHLSDWTVVQWPELIEKLITSKNVACINLFFKTF